jgi:UPF0716 protein FxsA
MTVGRRVMRAMQEGTAPEQTLLDSGAVMFAGVLFMVPGFFSDVLGLIVLLPTARRYIWRGVSFGMRGRTRAWHGGKQGAPAKPQRQEDVIDVEYTEVPPGQGRGGSSAQRDSPWRKP